LFKASWHEKQTLIVLIWSVLIFIGYNVITAPPAFSISSEEEEHCEDNGGDWSKEDKSCKFDDEEDEKEYAEKKYKHFANKPENRDNPDWEYDEEDS